jgi:CheY-like chemotaxis protein
MNPLSIPAPAAGRLGEHGAATDLAFAAGGSSREGVSEKLTTSRRILVVDDFRDSVDGLVMLLELLGHRVRAAYDGRAALAIADEWRPDVAILDIAMPGMDGYELARRLRAKHPGRGILLIALTGFGGDDHRRRAMEAGFDHYFVKPVAIDILVGLVTGS